jgi:Cof subfamily protein (haloacid dehalogenase superfamily)
LAIDIDGTLVNSRDELTAGTRVALRRAIAAGIRVVLATGRRYSRALPLVEPLGLDMPLVTASGGLVKHPADHRTLFQAEFPAPLLSELLDCIRSAGHDPLVCGDTFTEGFDFYLCRLEVTEPELAEYLRCNPRDGRVWPLLFTCPPPGIFLACAMGTQAQMLALEQALHSRLSGKVQTHVIRSLRYTGFICEVTPAGVTKWSAIQRLAAMWGIDSRAICAVGDDVNDIPMIQAAGLGVAMGNAAAEVKAAADRIAPAHDEDGLATVIGWLLR